jgi:hypothetical protein
MCQSSANWLSANILSGMSVLNNLLLECCLPAHSVVLLQLQGSYGVGSYKTSHYRELEVQKGGALLLLQWFQQDDLH